MNHLSILRQISNELARLGVPYVLQGTHALSVKCDFVDALWNWHVDPIHYELTVKLDSAASKVMIAEKVADSDPVLYCKVIFSKLTSDGTRVDTVLDLGVIARTITKIVEDANWRILIINRSEFETQDVDQTDLAIDEQIEFVKPLRVRYDPRWLRIGAASVAAVLGVFLFITILLAAGDNVHLMLKSNQPTSTIVQLEDDDVPLANPGSINNINHPGSLFVKIGQYKFYSAYAVDDSAHIYRYDIFKHDTTTIYSNYAWGMSESGGWLYFTSFAGPERDDSAVRYRIQPDGSQLERLD